MKPEHLDMHKRLQPLYKRVMGEWQKGDKAYRIANVFGEPLDSQIWPDDKRVEIVIITSKSSVNSYWHCISDQGERLLTDDELLSVTCWRIPLTIDSEHPERGLWRMLNKENWEKMHAKILDTGVLSYMLGGRDWCIDDPITAILKALCEQEGV